MRFCFALLFLFSIYLLVSCDSDNKSDSQGDAFVFLETRQGDVDVANWVAQENNETLAKLQEVRGLYDELKQEAKNIYDVYSQNGTFGSIDLKNGYVYMFSNDAEHPYGILRRILLADYITNTSNWEDLLDMGKVNQEESKVWIPKEYSILQNPSKKAKDKERCLVTLTPYGASKSIIREFDFASKKFVKPDDKEQGFYLENIDAFDWVKWLNEDTLLVLTYLGPDSVTDETKFPIILKKWQRGTPFSTAETVFTGSKSIRNLEFHGISHNTGETVFILVASRLNSSEDKYSIIDTTRKYDTAYLPLSTRFQYQGDYNGLLLFILQEPEPDLPEIKTGSIVAIPLLDALVYKEWDELKTKIERLWEPQDKQKYEGAIASQNHLFLHILDNINGKLLKWDENSRYSWDTVQDIQDQGSIKVPKYRIRGGDVVFSENIYNERIFLIYQNFLVPQTLYLVKENGLGADKLRVMPEGFDSSKFQSRQFTAPSQDGTLVPYYVISHKGMGLDGKNPTLLYGYGGFGETEVPLYRDIVGKLWLERGGVYVSANIRGGGEFGPDWHNVATKRGRNKSYEDFIAVAEDIIKRGITSPAYLGIKGVSNGGNLVGSVFCMKPELFNAMIAEVGLFDMLRFKVLGGETFGSAYTAEFCDPDASQEDYDFLAKYSPYHNVPSIESWQTIPLTFLSTRSDDYNVHPGHSRKMHAKLQEMGYPAYFMEHAQGGHSGSSSNEERAKRDAMEIYFLIIQLMAEKK
ncbi:MAG: S9 family peptidase [Candidatus Brocadiae bacterium]|nr:S9 family peptidase [Candidatus Brocadiia bacterium]